LRNGYSKTIVRDAMAPYMPREVAYRKVKIGFTSPIVDWMKGPLRQFMLDTVESREMRESALVDASRVAKAVKRVIDSENPTFDEGQHAWMSLSPFLWEQAMLKGRGAAA
jgi:asparagine synthase (glutamine-hydrolysing)